MPISCVNRPATSSGVSPLGHAKPVKLVLDEDLQQFETMWAAAGTPFSVFPLTPEAPADYQRAVDNDSPELNRYAACARRAAMSLFFGRRRAIDPKATFLLDARSAALLRSFPTNIQIAGADFVFVRSRA